LDSFKTEIMGSNPTRDMNLYRRFSVLGCRGLATGRSPIQGVLPKCQNGFTVLEVNSESEQDRGPNPWKEQQN